MPTNSTYLRHTDEHVTQHLPRVLDHGLLVDFSVLVLHRLLSGDLHLADELYETLVGGITSLQEFVNFDDVTRHRDSQGRVVDHLELLRTVISLDVAPEADL